MQELAQKAKQLRSEARSVQHLAMKDEVMGQPVAEPSEFARCRRGDIFVDLSPLGGILLDQDDPRSTCLCVHSTCLWVYLAEHLEGGLLHTLAKSQ